jgi:hypothetical protein
MMAITKKLKNYFSDYTGGKERKRNEEAHA